MSVVWKVDRSQLREPFASDVNDLLDADPSTWYVTQGFRSTAQQAALYQKHLDGGPLAAPPGQSAHEAGLAVDLTLVRDGKDVWGYTDPDWRRIVEKVRAHPRLHSLDAYGDTDHIESVNWRKIAALHADIATH